MEDLKKNAQQEHYFNAIKPEYDALNAQMINDKKGDLQKFKNQIGDLLRVEIVGRYYYQKGKVKSSLENDTDLAEAIKTIGKYEKFEVVDLYNEPKLKIEELVKFKRLKDPVTKVYRNYPYPEFIDVPFNPLTDEYPYPIEIQ